jgi:hypothetical protein
MIIHTPFLSQVNPMSQEDYEMHMKDPNMVIDMLTTMIEDEKLMQAEFERKITTIWEKMQDLNDMTNKISKPCCKQIDSLIPVLSEMYKKDLECALSGRSNAFSRIHMLDERIKWIKCDLIGALQLSVSKDLVHDLLKDDYRFRSEKLRKEFDTYMTNSQQIEIYRKEYPKYFKKV